MSDFMYSLAQRLLEPQKSRGLRKTEVEDFTLGLLSILFPERGIEDLNLEKLSVFLRKKTFLKDATNILAFKEPFSID